MALIVGQATTNTHITNTDLLLRNYAKSDSIREILLIAENQEKHFAQGAYINSGLVLIKATIDDNLGLWKVSIEVDHGKVVYTAYDNEAQKINIQTIPSDKYIKDKENLNAAEIQAVIEGNSRSLDIDLGDTATLKKAKDFFADDYVLKYLVLNNEHNDLASRFVIWHIRAYRKIFINYEKKFSFLWKDTEFKNARSLAAAMRAKGLL
jgi:major membrane immunogen (membrane-anchored lipoprotein)